MYLFSWWIIILIIIGPTPLLVDVQLSIICLLLYHFVIFAELIMSFPNATFDSVGSFAPGLCS